MERFFRVTTQTEFDLLMHRLGSEGYRWASGRLPTAVKAFGLYGSGTVVSTSGDELFLSRVTDIEAIYGGEPKYEGMDFEMTNTDAITVRLRKLELELARMQAELKRLMSLVRDHITKSPFGDGDNN